MLLLVLSAASQTKKNKENGLPINKCKRIVSIVFMVRWFLALALCSALCLALLALCLALALLRSY